MPYEIYSCPGDGRKVRYPAITLRNGSRITVNRLATKILKDNCIDRVVILWDEKERKMAIRKSAINDPYFCKVTFNHDGMSFINEQSFAAFVGIEPKNYLRVRVTVTNNMLEAVIPKPPHPRKYALVHAD